MLLSTVLGGIVFKDIRPKSYPLKRLLEIHVGKLISPITMVSHEFYWLNYCVSNQIEHYDDEMAKEMTPSEYIEGVTMYDQEIHPSFFTVSRNII